MDFLPTRPFLEAKATPRLERHLSEIRLRRRPSLASGVLQKIYSRISSLPEGMGQTSTPACYFPLQLQRSSQKVAVQEPEEVSLWKMSAVPMFGKSCRICRSNGSPKALMRLRIVIALLVSKWQAVAWLLLGNSLHLCLLWFSGKSPLNC